jgi:aspartyl-tRNA(Asn)/glutamyl-tRNA(Gln) amidotransferase subunit A
VGDWRPDDGLDSLAEQLAAGRTTSRVLVEATLERTAAPDGEGARVFPYGLAADALDQAETQDRLRAEGRIGSRFAGIPISVKDNLDQAGQVTRAGSRLLAGDAPATADAPVIARLRAAGFVLVGRTNMTELAFSGLGLNPHYGTPANPRGTDAPRIPGGSSSGAAVSVAAHMVPAAIGTDTGGSCRIPAAFCGLVGFKPTGNRVPREGVFPLSTTLDCVGSLTQSARDCAAMDAVMAGEAEATLTAREPAGLKLAALEGYVLDGLEPEVAQAYAAVLDRLRAAGATVTPLRLGALAETARINARGGFSSAELYALLRDRLATEAHRLDPRVLKRVNFGAEHGPDAYAGFQAARARLIAETAVVLDGFDAVLMPTTPIVAPRFDELERDEDYGRINGLALRNPSIANMLDRPAVTLPCEQPPGALPVGLTLMGASGQDRALLAIVAGVEPVVRGL